MSDAATIPDLLRRLETHLGLWIAHHEGDRELSAFVRAGLAAHGIIDPDACLERLWRDALAPGELDAVVATLVSRHTFFFREVAQLRTCIGLLAAHPERGRRPLTIWSAGCATGEEPYSLAMLCEEEALDVEITATDLHVAALNHARAARYPEVAARHLPDEYRRRFMRKDGNAVVLTPEVVRRVRFAEQDLRSSIFIGEWDLVICRNVLIYYQPEVATRIAAHLGAHLRNDGWLILGTSDHLGLTVDESLSRHLIDGWVAYRRGAPTPLAPPVVAPKLVPARQPLPPVEAVDTYPEAARRLQAGDRAGAQRVLEDLLRRHPDDVLARTSLGTFHLAAHQFEEAEASYNRAAVMAPLLPDVHYLLGVLHKKVGRKEQALASLRCALFLDETFWPAAFLLAGLWEQLGAPERASAELRHTEELMQKHPDAPFRTLVRGFSGIDCPPEEVLRRCRSA